MTVISGVPAAAGTSGNATLETAGTAGAGTSGNVALVVGTVVGAYTHGSARLTRMGLAGDLAGEVYHPATDSSTHTGNAEGMFDRSVNIPAYALKAGAMIEIEWKVRCTSMTGGGDTMTTNVVIGPTPWNAGTDVVIATSGAVAALTGEFYEGRAVFIVKATGAPGTFDAMGMQIVYAAGGVGAFSFLDVNGSNVDTTVQNVVGVTNVFSTADANTATLEMIKVKVTIP